MPLCALPIPANKRNLSSRGRIFLVLTYTQELLSLAYQVFSWKQPHILFNSMSGAVLVGLSGVSSSGKTTLARLLRTIFSPHLIILHQDDFYRPEAELPIRHGLRDWDCAEAIDIPAFVSSLRFIREHGRLPDSLVSKEDQNEVGESGVSSEEVERLKSSIRQKLDQSGRDQRVIVVIDGFLLFGKSVPEIREIFDLKLMLRVSYELAKKRREARTGYVTLEGFWEDPPGYVDLIVWPGYETEHAFMFKCDNVEGDVNEQVATDLGIEICPGKGSWTMGETLHWTVDLVAKHLVAKHEQQQSPR